MQNYFELFDLETSFFIDDSNLKESYQREIARFHPDRFASRILKYKDRDWLSVIEGQNHGRQLHGRSLRIWRWERPLVNLARHLKVQSWHELALDRRSWISNLDSHARWFRAHRA